MLSSQYTLENLMEAYRDSILLEIQNYNHVLHSMLKQAKMIYPQKNTLVLEVKDIVLYRDLQEELIRILEKIIVERCGISASLSLNFVEMESSRHREEDEIMIRRKVAEISKRLAGSTMTNEDNDDGNQQMTSSTGEGTKAGDGKKDEAAAQKSDSKGNKTDGGKVKEFKGKDDKKDGKADYRRPQALKRSDNPDVIYGKDFDDDEMASPISDIDNDDEDDEEYNSGFSEVDENGEEIDPFKETSLLDDDSSLDFALDDENDIDDEIVETMKDDFEFVDAADDDEDDEEDEDDYDDDEEDMLGKKK